MDESWRETREVHERIRWSRMHRTEFARPIDGARSLNIRPGTYRTYEQSKADGGRVPPLPIIQKIAAKYDVSWQWMATGEGTPYDKAASEFRVMTNELVERINKVPDENRAAVIAAVNGVLAAFERKAS